MVTQNTLGTQGALVASTISGPGSEVQIHDPMANMINKAIYKANKIGQPERRPYYSLAEIERLAGIIMDSGEIPPSIKKREMLITRMIAGQELGLSPMQSIGALMTVGGIMRIYGDAGMTLVLRSPFYFGHQEWINTDDPKNPVAWAMFERLKYPALGPSMAMTTMSKERLAQSNAIIAVRKSFSWAQAVQAGLPTKGKNPAENNWMKYPGRMLQFRARWLALRDLFADVLAGMSSVEEAEDWEGSAATFFQGADLGVDMGQVPQSSQGHEVKVTVPVEQAAIVAPRVDDPKPEVKPDQAAAGGGLSRTDPGEDPEKGFHFADVLKPTIKPQPITATTLLALTAAFKTWAEAHIAAKKFANMAEASKSFTATTSDFYGEETVKNLSEPQGLEYLAEITQATKDLAPLFRRHRT